MDVTAFLADSVVVAEGKLYVQGAGWNIVSAPTFPTRHNRIGIGLVIHVPYSATNQMHKLEVGIQDEDGHQVPLGVAPDGSDAPGPLFKLGGQFNVGRPPLLPPGDEQVVPLAMNIDGVLFENPGAYAVVIEINGTEVKRLRFRLQAL